MIFSHFLPLGQPPEDIFGLTSTNYDGFCRYSKDGKLSLPHIVEAKAVKLRPFASAINECHQKCRTTNDCDAFSVIDIDYVPRTEGQFEGKERLKDKNCFLYQRGPKDGVETTEDTNDGPFPIMKGNGYLGASCYVMHGMQFEKQ